MTGDGKQSPEERRLFALMGELIDRDPESALEKISIVETSMKEAGANLRMVHLMRFLAYTNLALKRGSETGRVDVGVAETALEELRKLFKASEYEETETYQKEVEVRPAGLFRKAQTELRTFTRAVRKTKLDPEVYRRPLNTVAPFLEKERSGAVSRILGQISLQCLIAAGHVSSPPHVDIGVLNETDRVSLGEVWLPVDKPVRAAFVAGIIHAGSNPRAFVLLLEDTHREAEMVVHYQIEKRGGNWVVEKCF